MIVETVGDMQPTVEAACKTGVHAVRVALEPERAKEDLAFISVTVAVGVAQEPDVRDTPDDGPVLVGINAGRNV